VALVEKVELQMDTSDADQASAKFQKKYTASMVAAQLATQALTSVLGFLGDSLTEAIEAANEFERTNIKLHAALRNQGAEIDNNVRALNDQAAQLEIVAGISDEAIRNVQSLALNMGVAVTDVDDFTRAAIRLSNTSNLDLNGAMRQLTKTLGGTLGELSETVPELKSLTKEELAAGRAADFLNERLENNLTLLQEGTVGKINRLTNAWDSFGEALVTAAKETDTFNTSIEELTRLLEELGRTISTQGVGAGALTILDQLFAGGRGVFIERGVGAGQTGFAGAGSGVAAGGGAAATTDAPGTRRRPGAGGGRAGGGFGAGADLGEDFVVLEPGGDTMEENLGAAIFEAQGEAAQRSAELELGLGEVLEEDRQAKHEANKARVKELEQLQRRALRSATQASEAAMERDEARRERWGEFSSGIVTDFAQTAVSAFIAWANGADVAFDRVLQGFLQSTGSQIIAQGIADLVAGASRLAFGYGSDATAYALLEMGAAAVGIGGAMVAGSLAVGEAMGMGSTAGGGNTGVADTGGTQGAAPGAIGRAAGAEFGAGGGFGGGQASGAGVGQGPGVVNINVFGQPTAQTGEFIDQSLRQYGRRQ
jgi:hypothetical protein